MTDRGSRQGFLGGEADEIFSQCRVAVVGLGGGGSHIVQQLAHAGFRRFVLYDPDIVESTNLNRLVGATEADARAKARKVDVAARLIRGLCEDPIIDLHAARWEDEPHALRGCDLVFGCLDGFAARRDLEATARRYLLPLIDIGLDVAVIEGSPPQMAGQVILSMPGEACMSCLGFLTRANLAREAGRYGDAGIRPQVVWGNGVLASTAVGLGVDLLTDWTRTLRSAVYLSFDGNKLEQGPHVRLGYLAWKVCPHYPLEAVGDPVLQPL